MACSASKSGRVGASAPAVLTEQQGDRAQLRRQGAMFAPDDGEAVGALKVLAHEDRLLLLCQLSHGEMCVSDLVQALGIHQPAGLFWPDCWWVWARAMARVAPVATAYAASLACHHAHWWPQPPSWAPASPQCS